MELLVITNRKKNDHPTRNFSKYYIEEPRDEGAGTSEMAILTDENAENFNGPIPNSNSHPDHKANRVEIIRQQLEKATQHQKSCVFFIHGYGTKFGRSIEQATDIHTNYENTAVISFSWPAKEKEGTFDLRVKYKSVQEVAISSAPAIRDVFTEIKEAINKLDTPNQLSINLLIHSMGNFLFEEFIRKNPEFDLTFFDNIILNQADVQITKHIEWVEKINAKRNVHITNNRNDAVLNISQGINTGEDDGRLGDSVNIGSIIYDRKNYLNLRASNAIYLDFTDAHFIYSQHQMYGFKATLINKAIKPIFQALFDGKNILELNMLKKNEVNNTYEVIEFDE